MEVGEKKGNMLHLFLEDRVQKHSSDMPQSFEKKILKIFKFREFSAITISLQNSENI